MKTEDIENACICEITAMSDGWKQRYYDLQDLFIVHCTLPVYQMNMGKKAPTYAELTRDREKPNEFKGMSLEELREMASE